MPDKESDEFWRDFQSETYELTMAEYVSNFGHILSVTRPIAKVTLTLQLSVPICSDWKSLATILC